MSTSPQLGRSPPLGFDQGHTIDEVLSNLLPRSPQAKLGLALATADRSVDLTVFSSTKSVILLRVDNHDRVSTSDGDTDRLLDL